ncbi:MAG: GNAT family N-acetyltransferase [Prochloraceae cyanobacterium]|nr:GNAT family N-acetyltransferase [Prochloraceae cyanobacterium]
MKWVISPLDNSHERGDFDCGQPQLNDYLKKYAAQNQKKGYSITFVATFPDSARIAGYYCASASTIEFKHMPQNISKKLPRYPAPVMLIGQLAVDIKAQGKGLGKTLLMHALVRAVKVASEIGIYAVRVDAIDTASKNFYLKYGFIPFEDAQLSLFLPLKTIKKIIEV